MASTHFRRAAELAVPLAFAFAFLVLVPVAQAHPGGPEQVVVEGDHVDAGSEVHVFGAFIEPEATVPMRIVVGDRTWELAPVQTTPDGTFDARFTLPADIPNGYAELVLTQPEAGDASTVFLVGPRTASTGADPSTPAASASLLDGDRLPALLIFGLCLVGILAVGALLLRGTGRKRA